MLQSSSVTLRELHALRHLQLTIVVDAGGLDRPIRWVYATELDDPTPYLRGGELVVTNGLWQRNGTRAEDFVDTLVAQDVCGLGYAIGAPAPLLSDALVEACRVRSLPLLTVGNPVSFGAIAPATRYPAPIQLEDGRLGALFAVPRDRPLAFLLCRKALDELSVEERAVIDQALTFLGLVFAQRRAIQILEMRFAADLIDQIDTGEGQSADP